MEKKPLTIGIVDYGMGNLHSVAKALAAQGGNALVSDDAARLAGTDLLVLPGVGSFGAAATALRAKGLVSFIQDWVRADRPYLGICLGYQLLFEESEETPGVPGFGILKGKVVAFDAARAKAERLPVPHMGWNEARRRSATDPAYFDGISPTERFYYVHSYFPAPADPDLVYTETVYAGPFASSVAEGNLFACQFHPEKSGAAGQRLLANLLRKAASATADLGGRD